MKSKSKSKGKAFGNKAQPPNASSRNRSSSYEAASRTGNGSNAQNYSQSNSGYGIWGDDAFPALGASAAVPDFNVWEERKAKMESVIALQPQNEYDEQAMLQQALALSLLEEEERKKQEEEEFMLQMETVKYEKAKRELEHIDAVDKTAASSLSKSQFEKTERTKESISRNAASNFNQKDKPPTSGGAKPKINKIIDSFGGWGLKNVKNNSGKLSEFVHEVVEEKTSEKQPVKYGAMSSSGSSYIVKEATGGRINTKVESRENSWPSEVKKHPADSGSWENEENLNCAVSSNRSSYAEKKAVGSGRIKNVESRENSWPSEVQKHPAELDSWENEKMLYNGKGTFTDLDDLHLNELSIKDKSKSSKLPNNVSPNKVLDTWLDSCDYENDDTLNVEKKSLSNDRVNSEEINFVDTAACIPLNTYISNYEKSEDDRDCNSEKARKEITDTFDEVRKQRKTEKNSWPNHKEVTIPQESIISQNNVNDHNTDTCSFETAQTSLKSNAIWANQSSTNSPYFSSFPGVLPDTKHDEMPMKFNIDAQNEFFNNESNEQSDMPPILPPKPVSVAPEEKINVQNEIFASETPNASSKDELPYIIPPQPVPGLQPQSIPMNNPLFNPACMMPGFGQPFPYGMDPVAMRQMLMLSNPFFASQLFAMEQYYRSMGMPVDLFSGPTAMPNVVSPAMLNMGPGAFPNAANAFMQSAPLLPQFQNPLANNLFSSESQNNNISSKQNSIERSVHLSESGVAASSTNDESILQNENDSWYQNYLSSDCSEAIPPPKPTAYSNSEAIPPPRPSAYSNSEAIPPPKASTYSNSEANVLSVPKFSQFNQCASQFNQNDLTVNDHTSVNYAPDCIASYASETNVDNKQKKTLSAIEACMTKTVVTGWDDSDEEVVGVHKPKSASTWDDDDSWGDPVPTKLLKNTYNDKRVRRQPVRQPQVSRQPVRPPQLSHFQKNKH